MKFGKQMKRLADKKHLYHCMAYDVLKKAISVLVPPESGEAGASGTDVKDPRPPDSRFYELLEHELTKVNRFAALQLQTLLDNIRDAQLPLLSVDPRGPPSEETLASVERLLDTAVEDLVSLEHFRRLNFTGFRKIVKKFDKQTSKGSGSDKGALSSWFIPRLLREFFVATPLDAHLLAISRGYAALRRHRRGAGEVPLPAPQPQQQPRSSTFWLIPSMRMRAICALIKRFEIVMPPTGKRFEATVSGGSPQEQNEQQRRLLMSITPDGLMGGAPVSLSTETSMTYYDAADFRLYKERLESPESAARGFHCRRTFAGQRQGAEGVVVERDGAPSALGTHAFTPISKLRASDAFQLGPYNGGRECLDADTSVLAINDAGAGLVAAIDRKSGGPGAFPGLEDLSPVARSQLRDFALEVRGSAGLPGLRPVATVGSTRLILRGDTAATEGVCLALDEDVQFGKGLTGPALDAPKDTIDFPYCLLEVSSSAGGPWLEELRGTGALRAVEGFTIGAQAVASVHKEIVPELPPWFQSLSNVETTVPPEAWGLTLEWRAAVLEAGPLARGTSAESIRPTDEPPGDDGGVPLAVQGPPILPPDIEPKSYLTSERTLMEWLHTALALAALGFALWKSSLLPPEPEMAGGAPDAGVQWALGIYAIVIVCIGLAITWYATILHLRRLDGIDKKQHTDRLFNGRRAPTLVASTIGAALVVHIAYQLRLSWLRQQQPLADAETSVVAKTVAAAAAAASRGH